MAWSLAAFLYVMGAVAVFEIALEAPITRRESFATALVWPLVMAGYVVTRPYIWFRGRQGDGNE